MNFSSTTVTLLVSMLAVSCAGVEGEDPSTSAPEGAATTSEQAWTSTNPTLDTLFLGEVSIPSGLRYIDIAVNSSSVYLSRSDNRIAYFSGTVFPTYQFLLAGNYQRLEWVASPYPWNLVASNDATRKIYYNVQTQPALIGSFPAGVTALSGIAARGGTVGTKLDLWITYWLNGRHILQAGTFDKITGSLTWGATTGWGIYNRGLTYGLSPDGIHNNLYAVLNYTKSYYVWASPSTLATAAEGNFNYTEHAYTNSTASEWLADRNAPEGLAYQTGKDKYYGIDFYQNTNTGRTAWVLTANERWDIMP